MLVQVAGLLALLLSTTSLGGATGLPGKMDRREDPASDGDNSTKDTFTVSWDVANVSFMLGQNATVHYNLSIPTAQPEFEMFFFLCKTSDPTSVTSANAVQVRYLPGYCVETGDGNGNQGCLMTGPPGSIVQASAVITLQTVQEPPPSPDQLQNFFLCLSSEREAPLCQPNTYSPLFAVNAAAPGGTNGPTDMFPTTALSITSSATRFMELLGNPTTIPVSVEQTFVPQVTSGPSGTSTIMVPQSLATQSTITSTLSSTTAATPAAAVATSTPTDKADDVSKSDQSSGMSTGGKVGVATGAIAGFVLLAFLALFCFRRRHRIPNLPRPTLPRPRMPSLPRPRFPKVPMSFKIHKRSTSSPIENLMAKTMQVHNTSGDLLTSEKLDMLGASSADEDDGPYEDTSIEPSPYQKASHPSPTITLVSTQGVAPLAAAVATKNHHRKRHKHQRNHSSYTLPKSPRHQPTRQRAATGDLLDDAGLTREQQTSRSGDKLVLGDARRSPQTVLHPSPLLLPPPLHLGGGQGAGNSNGGGGLAVPMSSDGWGNSGFTSGLFLPVEPGMTDAEIERLKFEEQEIDKAIAAAERVVTPRVRSYR